MQHPLDGARFKVVRAQVHLDTLKDRIGVYLNSKPYEAIVQMDRHFVTVQRPLVIPPSPELGGIVGECVYSLMAALDYVVWELCGKFANRPLVPPPDGTDKPSFPLYKDQSGFTKNRHRLTRYGIPAAVVDVIASVQPYNTGYESLFLLYHLVNQDKHRVPLVALAQLDGKEWRFNVDVLRTSPGSDIPAIVTIASVWGATPSLGISAGFESAQPGEQIEVNVDAKVTVHVTLPYIAMPGEPVDRTLEQLIKTVADLIPRFDGFFV